jgi:HNH endonuclease
VSRRTCIFCLVEKEEGDFNEEHVFPQAIGGSLVIRTVCTTCNSELGSAIDAALIDHVAIQTRRSLLNIQGNSRKVPDPLAQGMLVKAPHLKVRDIVTPRPGPLRVVPDVRRKAGPDSSERVQITMDARDEAGLIAAANKILVRSGLEAKTPEELRPHIRRESDPTPEVVVPVAVDLADYKPALVKIAYELTSTWLGDTYLADPAAVEIRRVLRSPNPLEVVLAPACFGRIGPRDQGALPEDGAEPNQHLALITPGQGRITALIHVFDIFEGVIVMSENSERYPSFAGRVVVIDPVAGTREEKSL